MSYINIDEPHGLIGTNLVGNVVLYVGCHGIARLDHGWIGLADRIKFRGECHTHGLFNGAI